MNAASALAKQKRLIAVAVLSLVGSLLATVPRAGARPVSQAGDHSEAELPSLSPAPPPASNSASTPGSVPVSSPASAPVAQKAIDPVKLRAALRAIGEVRTVEPLQVPREPKLAADRYRLDGEAGRAFERFVAHPAESPDGLSAKDYGLLTAAAPSVAPPKDFRYVRSTPGAETSRAPIDALSVALTPEKPLKIAKHVALTADEFRFLGGLLLFQKGEECSVAVGLFHKFSKAPGVNGQANYYLAMCAKQLGLEGDFLERARRTVDAGSGRYATKILKELDGDLPEDFIVPFGTALFKHLGSAGNLKMDIKDPLIAGNARYWLAEYGARTGKFKTVLVNAALVSPQHPKRRQAEFLIALAEYQGGNKAKALRLEEELVSQAEAKPGERELLATAALNLARMQFQEERFKPSTLNFLKVYKDHPLWLQSLTEMGWAQLRGGDFEGAIGNMYSIQSPYFKAVYKPESYVIRTIGYLNLCQYGDAYRTLSRLEKQYRPWLEKMDSYSRTAGSRSAAVRRFIRDGALAEQEIEGLPSPVLREMARHKDFLSQQKALNARLDERPRYAKLLDATDLGLKRARLAVTASRLRLADVKAKILAIARNPALEPTRLELRAQMEREFDVLNDRFFDVDVMNEAKASIAAFQAESVQYADERMAALRRGIEKALTARLERLRGDLRQILENNELLRYEVFAGSGENLRYQIGGGQRGKRVLASVLPQSKSLRWDFDGEYWEDEVGHYRSSLRNNCAETASREQAQVEKGDK